MLDVGPSHEHSGDDADLAVFVDRLAAAGSDRPTALARAQIYRAIEAGVVPPGLRRLAEALAASVGEIPPAPRTPSDEAHSVVDAVRGNNLVVLQDFDTPAVAAAVASLVADGRRVMVTAGTPAELAVVRDALPAGTQPCTLDRLPALSPSDMRELRRLIATSTPARRARSGQQLPPEAALPHAGQVADLCRQTERQAGAVTGAWMVPGLLAELDHDRRAAVTSVARCVDRSLGELPARGERDWTWSLLSGLVHSTHRAAFDRLLEDTAQATAAMERARHADPVSFTGHPPTAHLDRLRRYCDFLESGGRARSYFRSAAQREVQPVLQQARVGTRVPESSEDVRRVIDHLELAERLHRIERGSTEIGVPVPRNESDLLELSAVLLKVAAAARSVGALRHDVLFLAANSPLSVPDVDTAEEVARAILEYSEHGSAAEAGKRLDAMADELARRTPVAAMAPEHEMAVAALRRRDAATYAMAVDALGAARREMYDEARRTTLLRRLAEVAPRLAEAWTALGEQEPAAFGLASFVPMDVLLSALPPTDSADVVLVLGAARLGVERLLLMGVAPRMVAVVAPDERPDEAPTLLSVLQRGAALVIRGRAATGGQVVQLNPAARPVPTRIGRAGA